jgi:hypothetical protein
MGIFAFMLAAVLSLPKQFITVYIGVMLESDPNGESLLVLIRYVAPAHVLCSTCHFH